MAQPARESRKTPLSIEPFWERPTSDPPIRWEKWRIQVKLAILARENITIDTLLQPKPTEVRLPAEPKYEVSIEDATEETERDRRIRNNQLKLQWELKCQKIIEAGILCGERPWNLCDQKCVSLLYLSIGTEGRRLLTQKFPHDNIYDLSTLKLWEMMEIAFIRPRNITFDRYVFFSRKQKKGESVEQFYSVLKELAENCDFENREEAIIRDIFITNMLDDDIQRELLRDTVEPERALSIAVNMEMGNQNQQRISSNNGGNGNTVNAIQQNSRFRGAGVRGNQSTRITTNRTSIGQCRGCGQSWTPTHRQVCPAMGKKCNYCGLQNHFAKVCRRRINNSRTNQQNNRINTVENVETSNQNSSQENQNVNYINYNEETHSDYDSSDELYVATIENVDSPNITLLNLSIIIGNTNCDLLLDSGSGCTIINMSLAREIMLNCIQSQWSEKKPQELKSFLNDIVQPLGTLKTPVKCNDWYISKARITVVPDGFRPILGRDLFDQLGITITQKPCPKIEVNNVDQTCVIKKSLAKEFPELISRIGKSKNHTVNSKFHRNYRVVHQKGRKVPIHLQPKVKIELEKLLNEEHIEKLDNCSDQFFISPIVITVKKDQSIKIALDSKILNKAIHKNKYQMPNIDSLIQTISQTLSTAPQETAYFTTLDLQYAYSQLNLHNDTARHCNFNIVSGDMTGTYRFKTGFYGLTDMPAEFQKAIDCTLAGLENTFCFLDDILIVSRGRIEKHLDLVRKCLIRLDQENLRINLAKCHFAKDKIEWLGHNITQSGVTPLSSKTDAIGKLAAPTNLKNLRSFMGSVHHLGKFIPNLSQLCYPLRPLLKKNTKFIWTDEHEKQFCLIKEKIAETTENKHFNPELETRIKCDASRKGLGCALEQRTPNGWHTVAFASRFLNSVEDRYSVNELELLGVVWSIEHFKYYLYGKPFTVITDHRALSSIMRENRSNKSYNSRLTRWVDRLLPFDFSIDHLPGSKMGLVDYISRDPHQQAANISTYDEQFIVAKLDVIKRGAKRFLLNAENYVDFAARNPPTKCDENNLNSINKFGSELTPRNPEHSNITLTDNSISELSPINVNTKPKIEIANNPNSLSAFNRSADQSHSNLNNFQRIAQKFGQVYMMSQPNSDDKTVMSVKQSTPSRVRFADAGPSTASTVSIAPAAPSTPTTPTTDTTGTSTSVDELYLDSFNFALSKIFSSSLMASLTTKDAILKEIRDCILTGNEDRCKQISPYIHSYWKDLHVKKSGCVCIDDRIALPHTIKDAYVDAIHATHPGTWGMTDMASHAWWPYMHRDLATKTAKCNPCVKIGKNLKSIIPTNKWAPLRLCKVPNEEIQIDFGGPIYNEKNQEVYFLACIDRFSKFPSAEVFENANADNILKFLQEYVLLHGIPRAIRLDQARCQTGQRIKTFCNQNNIELIEAPIHDHRAIGLVERLIQTIKNRLACIKTAARNQFNIKASINSIIYQLRICRQKTINISPFEAHFGRKANTPLSNITTKPDPKSLTYKNILNKYLDLETVRWDQLIKDENWTNEERSDTEVEDNKFQLCKNAENRQQEDPNKESRFILHPDVCQPLPRTETSLELKLAKKQPRTKGPRRV